MFRTKIVEKIKTHFMFSNTFFYCAVCGDNVETYFRAGQVIEDNVAHARCMLYT